MNVPPSASTPCLKMYSTIDCDRRRLCDASGHPSSAHTRHKDIASRPHPPENADGSLHYSESRSNGFAECAEAHIEPAMLHVSNTGRAVDHALTQLFALNHMPTAICCEQDRLRCLCSAGCSACMIPTPFDYRFRRQHGERVGLTTIRAIRMIWARGPPATLDLIIAKADNDFETTDETASKTGVSTPPIHESTQIRMMFRLSTGPATSAAWAA